MEIKDNVQMVTVSLDQFNLFMHKADILDTLIRDGRLYPYEAHDLAIKSDYATESSSGWYVDLFTWADEGV